MFHYVTLNVCTFNNYKKQNGYIYGKNSIFFRALLGQPLACGLFGWVQWSVEGCQN